jgi:hypothetical protein
MKRATRSRTNGRIVRNQIIADLATHIPTIDAASSMEQKNHNRTPAPDEQAVQQLHAAIRNHQTISFHQRRSREYLTLRRLARRPQKQVGPPPPPILEKHLTGMGKAKRMAAGRSDRFPMSKKKRGLQREERSRPNAEHERQEGLAGCRSACRRGCGGIYNTLGQHTLAPCRAGRLPLVPIRYLIYVDSVGAEGHSAASFEPAHFILGWVPEFCDLSVFVRAAPSRKATFASVCTETRRTAEPSQQQVWRRCGG